MADKKKDDEQRFVMVFDVYSEKSGHNEVAQMDYAWARAQSLDTPVTVKFKALKRA